MQNESLQHVKAIMMPGERELLQRVAEGDSASFRTLFNQYARHIYGLALRFTKSPQQAEDLTQEIFARIWLNRSSLKEVLHFRPFLNTVARNLIRDFLRKKTIATDNEPALLNTISDQSPGPQEKMDAKELQGVLDEAIGQLSPQLRTAFTLSRVEGLTHQQIAARMNISVLTSKNHLVRALASIRNYLRENYPSAIHMSR
jgi:RNA polymerase sigma-70 factor (ECF subfamily)